LSPHVGKSWIDLKIRFIDVLSLRCTGLLFSEHWQVGWFVDTHLKRIRESLSIILRSDHLRAFIRIPHSQPTEAPCGGSKLVQEEVKTPSQNSQSS
jgi:hypothetical protein